MTRGSAGDAGRPQGTTVREAAFELFRGFGMTTVFGNPGSTELPMFRDFPSDFRYVLGLQEAVVVAMADGYAAAHRRAALVNLHSAIGVGHALGSIFTAFRNQTPLVITAGQQARSILPFEPFLYSDQAAQLPKPYIKWSCEPARAEDVPAALARAYYVAMQPPQGPTLVSVPVDDWDRRCETIAPREVSTAMAGEPELLRRIATSLTAARRPVIVVGAGAARDGAWDAVIALAERHAAQVWAAPRSSRNAFPEDHRLFAGFLPPDRAPLVAQLEGTDLILALGAPVFSYHVEGHGPHIPSGAALVQLTDDPAAAAWAPVGLSVVTNVRLGVEALLRDAPAVARAAPAPRPSAPAAPSRLLTTDFLMQRIAAARPTGAIVVEEAPSSRPAMQAHLPMTGPDTFYTCASGGLGHGLPAAVGVALARRDRKVIALLGDGSAMYAIQGLWNAAELGAAVAFVIVNNRSYQALNEFSQHFGLAEPPGTRLPHLDFCALARSQGVDSVRVERRDDLDPALASAFSATRPMLVEVCVEVADH